MMEMNNEERQLVMDELDKAVEILQEHGLSKAIEVLNEKSNYLFLEIDKLLQRKFS
jgi:hypothetical protein